VTKAGNSTLRRSDKAVRSFEDASSGTLTGGMPERSGRRGLGLVAGTRHLAESLSRSKADAL
jgi:hypothetical protein